MRSKSLFLLSIVAAFYLNTLFASYAGQSGPAHLVKKLDTVESNGDSIPSLGQKQFAVVGSTAYFVATDGINGNQLWMTDGTAGNTKIVRYIEGDGRIDNLTPAGNRLFFTAATRQIYSPTNISEEIQVWRTDGTETSTIPLTTFTGGGFAPHVKIDHMCSLGNKLLFYATNGNSFPGLYVSDGTVKGTGTLNVGVYIDNGNVMENPVVALNGVGYFFATDSTNGTQLWRSDGTNAGTFMVKNIAPGITTLKPRYLTASGANVYFAVDPNGSEKTTELWKSDGSDAGTMRIGIYPDPGNGNPPVSALTDCAGTLVFDAFDGTHKGFYTASGATIAKVFDINDPNSFNFGRGVNSVANGKLYYIYTNGSTTDLHELNPVNGIVTPFQSGAYGSNPIVDMAAVGTPSGVTVYYRQPNTPGEELYANDRTNGINYLVKDINPGKDGFMHPFSGYPQSLFAYNDKLFCSADDGIHSREPWLATPTDAVMLKNINTKTYLGTSGPLVNGNGLCYFVDFNNDLLRSDGTDIGTDVTDPDLNPAQLPGGGVAFNGAFYCGGNYTSMPPPKDQAGNLLSISGNIGNAATIIKSFTGPVNDLLVLDSTHMLFTVGTTTAPYNKALYVTTGAAGNATQLTALLHTDSLADSVPPGVVCSGAAYYKADDGTGFKVWRTDGASAPTLVSTLSPDAKTDPSNPSGGKVLFVAGTKVLFFSAQKLVSIDGSTPTVVKDFSPSGFFSNNAVECNGKVCFTVSDNSGGNMAGLWTSDGVTATQVIDTKTSGIGINTMIDVNGTLFLSGTVLVGGNSTAALMKSNLTAAGTVTVHTFKGDTGSKFFNASGTLVFVHSGYFDENASRANSFGDELWRSDGTDAGTVMVQDIFPGPTSSNPFGFCVSGSNLFFIAGNPPGGYNDLWAMPLASLIAPAPVITNTTLSYSGTVSVPIAPIQITATNGPHSFSSYRLPLGLTLDPATGLISGTPAQQGTFTTTVSAVNGGSTAAIQITFNIGPQEPVFQSTPPYTSSLPAGTAIPVYTPVVSGVPAIFYTTTGTVPAWITVNPTTGAISGTPATSDAGSVSFGLVANNAYGTATQNISMNIIPPAPVITSSLTATAQVGIPFTYTLTATGTGTLSFSASLGSGLQGQGFTFDSATGIISGTPAFTGSHNIDLFVNDAFGGNDHELLVLTIDSAPAPTMPVITSPATATAVVNVPFSYKVTATGTAPITFSATLLPSGITFSGDTASGTFTATGTKQLIVKATNSAGSVSKIVDITIVATGSAPAITSANSITFNVGVAGTFTVTTTGTPTPSILYTIGTLPSGISFSDKSNGTAIISGTPAAGSAGTYPITLKATNGINPDATQVFTITISTATGAAPAFTSANTGLFNVGTTNSFTITTSGSPAAAITSSGTLPSGLTFTNIGDGTATISGLPAAGSEGTYPITLSASNGVAPNAAQTLTLTVASALPNQAPRDITMLVTSIAENNAVGANVSGFSTNDVNEGDTFTYSLAAGAGDTDNKSFSISAGGILQAAAAFDFETKNSYSIRVRSTDQGGLLFEKAFTVAITDVNETPPAPVISSAPTATPNPGIVGQAVQFSCSATSALPVTFTWDFGDGTTGTGSSVSHIFTPTGTYTITVTANNGAATVKSDPPLSVVIKPVVGVSGTPTHGVLTGELDSDGDGISDSVETAAGSNALDASSLPGGGAAAEYANEKTTSLKISKKKMLTLNGTLHIPAGYVLLNKVVVADIGGYTKMFKLDGKGGGKVTKDSIKITVKVKKKVVAEQDAKFKLVLNNVPATVTPDSELQILIGGTIFAK